MSEGILIAIIGFAGTVSAAIIAALVLYFIHKSQNKKIDNNSESKSENTESDSSKINVRKASLVDFVEGVDENHTLLTQIAVKEDGRAALFYNRKFKEDIELKRIEYDIDTSKLYFLTKDDQIRYIGLPMTDNVAKYLVKSDRILLVYMDDTTGQTKDGHYVPLRKFTDVNKSIGKDL